MKPRSVGCEARIISTKRSKFSWITSAEGFENGLGLSHDELIDLFVNKAGLALNDGEMFNPGGEGFMRLNVGTSRKILEQAMNRLQDAINLI